MSWSTNLYTWIIFPRQTYNTRDEVKSALDGTNRSIKMIEEKLKAYAITTDLKMLMSEDGKDSAPVDYVLDEVSANLSELYDLVREKDNLELLLDAWDDCHDKDGYAIAPPNNIGWNSSFLSGDFIKTKDYEEEKLCDNGV